MDPKKEYLVVITHDGDEKYITGRIVNEETKKEIICLISTPHKYHSHIVAKYQMTLTKNEVLNPNGGGILTIDRGNSDILTKNQRKETYKNLWSKRRLRT